MQQFAGSATGNYGGYETVFILFPGAAVAIIIVGVLLSLKKWKKASSEKLKEVV